MFRVECFPTCLANPALYLQSSDTSLGQLSLSQSDYRSFNNLDQIGRASILWRSRVSTDWTTWDKWGNTCRPMVCQLGCRNLLMKCYSNSNVQADRILLVAYRRLHSHCKFVQGISNPVQGIYVPRTKLLLEFHQISVLFSLELQCLLMSMVLAVFRHPHCVHNIPIIPF